MNKEQLKSYLEPYRNYVLHNRGTVEKLSDDIDDIDRISGAVPIVLDFMFFTKNIDIFFKFLGDILFLANSGFVLYIAIEKGLPSASGFIVSLYIRGN